MEPDLTDEELRKITRDKQEAIRQGQWKPVGDVLKEDYEKCKRATEKAKQYAERKKAREEREKQRRARGRGKGRYTGPKSEYTKYPNKVLEGLCKQSFGANQSKVFAYMVRNTWGWGKRCGFIRVTRCAKELGIPKSRVSEALSSLVKRGIVTVNRNKTYAIQTDTSLWRDRPKKKKKK